MSNAPNQLSFLPDDYLERKTQRRTNVICATLFIIVMGAITATFMLSERASRGLEERQARVDEQYADAAKKLETVKEMQERQRKMAHQAEVTASLLERVPRSYLLAEFTNALPSGVSLIDLTLDSHVRSAPAPAAPKTAFEVKKAELEAGKPKPPAAPQAKLYDVALKLTGVAKTDVEVAQFISRLSRSKLLKDVNLVVVEPFTNNDKASLTMRKFTLDMALNPDATIDPKTQPTKTAAVELGTK